MSGLLADVYSYIDTKKRQLKGLLADPAETIAQGVRNFGEDQRGLLNLQSQAYPWTSVGSDPVSNDPAKIAAAQRELADKAAQMGMAAATVWHGSPHKFDKFDSSKIGTGEGAQAYGHGLYLAENKNIAQGYADVVGRQHGQQWLYGEDKVSKPGDAGSRWALAGIDWLKKTGGDKDAAISAIKRNWEEAGHSIKGKDFRELKKWITDADFAKVAPDNNLYKVDLPDDQIAKMLDWDKPLSQQHPDVQKALTALKDENGYDALQSLKTGYGANFQGATGQDILRALERNTSVTNGRPEVASSFLKKQGIPGIRYLDGGSRTGGAGTSNYVVFPGNEGLLSILERNGQQI